MPADVSRLRVHLAAAEARADAEVARLTDQIRKFSADLMQRTAQRDRLLVAIRAHRDARGDDRCWRDDEDLYAELPGGYTPAARDSAVELDRCRQYIASRQNTATVYVSPQRRIEELESFIARTLAQWRARVDDMERAGGDSNGPAWKGEIDATRTCVEELEAAPAPSAGGPATTHQS